MSHSQKKRSPRRQAKRSPLRDTLILISMGIIGLYLLSATCWVLFVWCMIIVSILAGSCLTYTISLHLMEREAAPNRQTEIVRDSRYISPQLCQAVWSRCGGQCVQCQSKSFLEYDHIIPIAKGGATSYENLQILCRSCNRHKSDHI